MFFTTDRDIVRAAVVVAAGYHVRTFKLNAAPRCAFEYQNTPEIRKLLDAYELKQLLPIPQKAIMQAHAKLLAECKALKAGRIGGVV